MMVRWRRRHARVVAEVRCAVEACLDAPAHCVRAEPKLELSADVGEYARQILPSFARSCHGGLLGAALSAGVMLCCSAFSPRAPSRPPGGDEPAIARSDSCAPPPQVCPRGIASHSSAGWRVRHRPAVHASALCVQDLQGRRDHPRASAAPNATQQGEASVAAVELAAEPCDRKQRRARRTMPPAPTKRLAMSESLHRAIAARAAVPREARGADALPSAPSASKGGHVKSAECVSDASE